MTKPQPAYTVSKFAAIVGIRAERAREWDKKKWLVAERTECGARIYRPHHIPLAIKLIEHARQARV